MSRRRVLLPSLVLVAAVAVTECGTATPASTGGPPTSAAAAPLSVVASTDVYGAIAAAVGGDAVQVNSIIDSPDADPHEYESTPADAVAVGRAQLLIYNGAGYDEFATRILEASSTKPATIDVVELSGLQARVPPGEEFNEHVWYSFPTVAKLADAVAADLGRADPARAATFTANAQAFTRNIDELNGQVEAIKARHAGARVAITEPVPLYLVEAAGLVNATPPEFSEAVEEGNDPPAAVLQETLAVFEGPDRVRALLTNAQTESPTTQRVEQAATANGVPVVPVTETLPAGVTDYVAWMTGQVDALSAALDQGRP